MPHLALRMAECFSDIASWTSLNRLRLNGDKTEAIWFHPARRSMTAPPVQLSGVSITPSAVVRNLGVYLDTLLSMENRAGTIAAACFSTLRVIGRHDILYLVRSLQPLWSSLSWQNWTTVIQSCMAPTNGPYINFRWSWIQQLGSSLTDVEWSSVSCQIVWDIDKQNSSILLYC